MTKTCLRLFFLVAAALPLAHGCDDDSFECLGSAVACDLRDPSECDSGCRLNEGCFGDAPVTCESLTSSPNLCLQTPGCRYLGSCEGGEHCPGLDFTTCGTTEGCMQVRRCGGEGVTCDRLENSQCELYAQCELGSRCEGKATSCGDLDTSKECLDVPGCYAADTTPPVVANAGVSR